MYLREFIAETDYPILVEWWKGHGFPVLPVAVLPKLGLVVEHDTKPIACAFLYMDNSVGVCMLEWLTTAPEAAPKAIPSAIRAIVEVMAQRAKEMNYGVMLTTCRQPALARVFEKNGFEKTDEAVIHLLKLIELQPEK
jgi:N-acetylglutamate synthase-like GNAT family acetyltransferase